MTWTWSISASGTRDGILADLRAQECPPIYELDEKGGAVPCGQTLDASALFEKHRTDAITTVTGWAPGDSGEVSVSGNDTIASPTINKYKPKQAIDEIDPALFAQIKADILAGKI